MATVFVNKTQAISLISLETGYGRRIIEKMMDQLAQAGKIKVIAHLDGRTLLLTRADVELIVQALKSRTQVE